MKDCISHLVVYRVGGFIYRMLESFMRLSWLSLRGDVGALRELGAGSGSCLDEGLTGPGEMACSEGRVRPL